MRRFFPWALGVPVTRDRHRFPTRGRGGRFFPTSPESARHQGSHRFPTRGRGGRFFPTSPESARQRGPREKLPPYPALLGRFRRKAANPPKGGRSLMARACICGRTAIEGETNCERHRRKAWRGGHRYQRSYDAGYQEVRRRLLATVTPETRCALCGLPVSSTAGRPTTSCPPQGEAPRRSTTCRSCTRRVIAAAALGWVARRARSVTGRSARTTRRRRDQRGARRHARHGRRQHRGPRRHRIRRRRSGGSPKARSDVGGGRAS